MRHRIPAGLLASAVACTVVLGTGVASASGGWRIQSTYYPPGVPKQDIALNQVSCAASNACLAVGRAGPSKFLSETWNGTRWSPRLTPYPFGGGELLNVSCSGASACTAVGFYANSAQGGGPLAERWNGTGWHLQTIPEPATSELTGVSCPGARSCITVGAYETGSQSYTTLAEAWNGTRWAVLPTPRTGYSEASLVGVSCPAPTACVAIGSGGNSITRQVPFAESWNGEAWTIQKTPALPANSFPALNSVSCSAADSCTAIGYHETSSGEEPLAERWNGVSWALQHIRGAANHSLFAVSCPSATSCTAAGAYTNRAGVEVTLAAHWNGKAWALQRPPNPAGATRNQLNDVSCPTTTVCEAVGFIHTTRKNGRFRDQTLVEDN